MRVKLVDFIWGAGSTHNAYRSAAMQAVGRLGMKAGAAVLEPVMTLEIAVDEQYVGNVLSDLTRQRRGTFLVFDLNQN